MQAGMLRPLVASGLLGAPFAPLRWLHDRPCMQEALYPLRRLSHCPPELSLAALLQCSGGGRWTRGISGSW